MQIDLKKSEAKTKPAFSTQSTSQGPSLRASEQQKLKQGQSSKKQFESKSPLELRSSSKIVAT